MTADDVERRIKDLEERHEKRYDDCKSQTKTCLDNFGNIKERLSTGAKTIALHSQQLENTKEWQEKQDVKLDKIQTDIADIKSCFHKKMGNIDIEMAKKPTWLITGVFGIMGSLIGALIMFAIKSSMM